jgi:hypothetical protein
MASPVVTRPPLTLEQQADMIGYLIRRATMKDGRPAGKAWMLLTAEEMEDLHGIAQRLRRIAPHEAAIKRMVVGK